MDSMIQHAYTGLIIGLVLLAAVLSMPIMVPDAPPHACSIQHVEPVENAFSSSVEPPTNTTLECGETYDIERTGE